MNHAAPQSTVPAPLTARDTLAALLHDVITSGTLSARRWRRCAALPSPSTQRGDPYVQFDEVARAL